MYVHMTIHQVSVCSVDLHPGPQGQHTTNSSHGGELVSDLRPPGPGYTAGSGRSLLRVPPGSPGSKSGYYGYGYGYGSRIWGSDCVISPYAVSQCLSKGVLNFAFGLLVDNLITTSALVPTRPERQLVIGQRRKDMAWGGVRVCAVYRCSKTCRRHVGAPVHGVLSTSLGFLVRSSIPEQGRQSSTSLQRRHRLFSPVPLASSLHGRAKMRPHRACHYLYDYCESLRTEAISQVTAAMV